MKLPTPDALSQLKQSLSPEQMKIVQELLSEQDTAWQQKLKSIPILAPLMGSFGLVSTFYGFEKILDRTILIQYPWFLLALGVTILLLTGVFYRKL